MTETKFSIVIPTYNRGYCITETINSVLAQTWPQFEILIVDDGSTDDTESVVAKIKDARLKYFKKKNGERAQARNFGIDRSTGDYITFLDSDDLLKRDHLEVALNFALNHPAIEVFHLGYDVVTPESKVIYKWKPLPNPVNEKLIEGNFLSCLGVFVRRDVLVANKFNEDRALSGSEDYELWVRLSARYKIQTLPFSTAYLVNHEHRSVLKIQPESFHQRMSLFEHYLKMDPATIGSLGGKIRKLFAYHQVYAGLHYALAGHRKTAVRCLLNAIKDGPEIFFNKRFWVVVKKLTIG